ncbi:IclR family transcriptional regulator [Parasphingorhabdus cellanae]|uniref:Helix-turn-helix domain-containing protein n=1 Tax=Parasphingorhabdus cellanae TaxID=2806553 RepID=A0ABX7T2Q3_9SPHN|nr:helix-turn-helix domain-containing protein [Parasphingorhabdus cellanae]QTD55834.1 helix-turn-helix domain-containing protein [Parasphingorhabdus cellanae]
MQEPDEPSDNDLSTPIIKSVEVAVQILDVLTESQGVVRVTQIAKQLGMTKARISRHLQTLTHLGLVAKAREGEGYVFGRKLVKYGRSASFYNNITEIAKPHLKRLHKITGHTAFVATATQAGALITAAVQNSMEPGIMVQPGMVLRLPTSPSARLLHMQNNKKSKSAVIDRVAELGLDFEIDPTGNGLGGVAAPVFEQDGTVTAAIGLILSSSLFLEDKRHDIFEAVKEAATSIQDEYTKEYNS